MTILVLFAHADPTATPPFYTPAFAGRNVEARFFVSHFAGLSSAYDKLADSLKDGDGRILPKLLTYAGAEKGVDDYEGIVLASWSAGYELAERLFAIDADRREIDAWVALDSGYGEATPGVLAFARDARAGRCLYFAGHTEIVTSYKSSGQFLADVIRKEGIPNETFRVEDWGGTAAADHVTALRVHGPKLLAAALDALPDVIGAPTTDPNPITDEETTDGAEGELGSAALEVAVGELAKDTAEVPGPKANPRIAEYLAGCERGGKGLGLASDEIAWCAAFASWCAREAIAAGAPGPAPHGYRAAVAELWSDAKGAGATRDTHYLPKSGDLAIWARSGGDPRKGGTGHVGRVEEVGDGAFTTIEGNHGDKVARVSHKLGEAGLVGWIVYP